MGWEEPYESWKRQRAGVSPPGDFADRVMASIHGTRRQVWWLMFYRLTAAAGRSWVLRAAVCSLALAVWMTRIGIVLAIFVPR